MHLTGDSFWGDGGLSWTFSQEGETKRTYYTSSGILEYDALFLEPGEYFVKADSGYSADAATVTVVRIELVPDWNHDRKIDEHDRNRATPSNPFRFWINDDADNGDVIGEDSRETKDCPVPWKNLIRKVADCELNTIRGRRDLVDFFPVWLDLEHALDLFPPENGYEYKLRQADAALKAVYTDLTRDRAGEYLTTDGDSYGPTFSQNSYEADKFIVHSDGTKLSDEFLNKIRVNPEKGILLLEGVGEKNRQESKHPLVLEISKKGTVLCERELPLSLSGVEQMYRFLNLRHICGDSSGGASYTGEPSNNPDDPSNGRNVIFIHGFNEDIDSARGNIAETYKRLYWSGSRAKYTGVTWRGDDGWPTATHYHKNVINAFETAPSLACYIIDIHDIQGEEVNVIAFSLGNMVVSSAIQDWGADVDRYFMLHAAVPVEAYDQNTFDFGMVHTEWTNYYKISPQVLASKWYNLFSGCSDDHRKELTWVNRFPRAVTEKTFNFYAGGLVNGVRSGDEVLEIRDDGRIGFGGMWEIATTGGRFAWYLQELWKGGHSEFFGGSDCGGWEFTLDPDYWHKDQDGRLKSIFTPLEMNSVPQEVLRVKPFFDPGHPENALLYSDTGGSVFAKDNQARLLADMIPALSAPAGANPIDEIELLGGINVNMQGDVSVGGMQTSWPIQRLHTRDWKSSRWLHGDYRSVAYMYVYTVFDKMGKTIGGFNL